MKRKRATPSKKKKHRGVPAGVAVAAVVVLGLGVASWFFFRDREASPERIRSVEEYIRLAEAANNVGDYESAKKWLSEGIRYHPDDSSLGLNLGSVLNNQSFEVQEIRGKRMPVLPTSLERVRAAKIALGLYREVQAREPGEAEPYTQAGTLFATWGLVEDALVELEQAYNRGERRGEYLIYATSIMQHLQGKSDTTRTGQR